MDWWGKYEGQCCWVSHNPMSKYKNKSFSSASSPSECREGWMSKIRGNCKLLSVRKPSPSQWDNFPTQKASWRGLVMLTASIIFFIAIIIRYIYSSYLRGVRFCTMKHTLYHLICVFYKVVSFASLAEGRGCIFEGGEELILITDDSTKQQRVAKQHPCL